MTNRDTAPDRLLELREFAHAELWPLAIRAGAASVDERMEDLVHDHQRPELPPGRQELILVILAGAAAHSLAHDPITSDAERAEIVGAAVALATFAHGYLAALAGARGSALATLGLAGAKARHASHQVAKGAALAWAKRNRAGRTLDDLATEITMRFKFDAGRPVAFATARKWVKGL